MGATEAGLRLDRFLQARARGLSRTRLQALIGEGRVTVNGRPRKPSYRLRAGDTVVLEVPPPTSVELVPEPLPLDILYEDAALLVVNKPAGLVVHPGAGHARGTLVHALLAHCGPSLAGVGGVRRPGIVHRLDRGTSGLLVVAKTDAAHVALSRQLKARQVERRYLALVHGTPPPGERVVDRPIGRDPLHRQRMAVRPAGEGRPARTRYQAEEWFREPVPLALVGVQLETGRTHQVRVHLASEGYPVVGDRTYRRRSTPALPSPWAERVAALGGVALHAGVLGFVHPATGAWLRFEVPPPPAFQALLEALRAANRPGDKMGAGDHGWARA